jgi:hypothetical protein
MKVTALVLLLAMLFTPNASHANDIVIKRGTEVLLKVIDKLKSGQVKKGTIVEFLVEKAVKDENGFVLIPDDARAYGVVAKSKSAGMMGTSGELEITLDKVEAFNGKDIPLRGSKEDQGSSSTAAVVAGTLLISVFSVFFRGSNAVIPSNTILRAYVAETIVLSADAAPQKQPPVQVSLIESVEEYLGIVISAKRTREEGFTILEVAPGGLSDFAGIQKGDILTKIDTYDLKEQDIERIMSYIALRVKHKAVINAALLRDGQVKAIKMQL